MEYAKQLPVDMIQHILRIYKINDIGDMRGSISIVTEASTYNQICMKAWIIGPNGRPRPRGGRTIVPRSKFPLRYRLILSELEDHSEENSGEYAYWFNLTASDWIK
jgi:hypothetical protein